MTSSMFSFIFNDQFVIVRLFIIFMDTKRKNGCDYETIIQSGLIPDTMHNVSVHGLWY